MQNREVRAPLVSIFKRGIILNTLTACWFMASGFVLYYSINVLFPTHPQVDLKLSPGAIGEIGVAANLVVFLSSVGWGWVADRYGRKAVQILPALITIPIAPLYLLTGNFTLRTIVIVEQNVRAALASAERVYILNNGHKVFQGSPRALHADPDLASRYLGLGAGDLHT